VTFDSLMSWFGRYPMDVLLYHVLMREYSSEPHEDSNMVFDISLLITEILKLKPSTNTVCELLELES
jgi:hypothetical protein